MYHRQVFKILLSNKVLEDPRQRRLFRTTDLTELFNLNEPIDGGSSESDQLFRDSKLSPNQPNFSLSKIEAMRKLASTLSKKISEKATNIKATKKQNSDKNKSAGADNGTSENKDNTTTDASFDSSTNKSKDVSVDSVNDDLETKESDNSLAESSAERKDKGRRSEENEEEEPMDVDKNETLSEAVIDAKNKEEGFEKLESKKTHSDSAEISQVDQDELEDGEILDTESNLPSEPIKESSISANNIVKDSKERKGHRKHKKHKKSKSEDAVSAMFEGERVSCLIGRRLGHSKEQDPVANADDQYVLSKLFSKTGNYQAKIFDFTYHSGSTVFELFQTLKKNALFLSKPAHNALIKNLIQ